MTDNPVGLIVDNKTAHIEEQLNIIIAELKSIKSAFPEDEFGQVDVTGHRRYHEEMLAAAKAQTEFWRELKLDIAKKGIWGLLIVIVGLILSGIAVKFGIPAN
jgi:hypothetical protein